MVWKNRHALMDFESARHPDDRRDPISDLWRASGKKKQLKLLLPGDQYPAIFTAVAQLCVLGSKIYPQGVHRGLNSGQTANRPRIGIRRSTDKFDWIKSVLLV